MINEGYAKKFCRDDISKIENYEQAINDTTQTWCCHHRDEVKILPSGVTVIRSAKDLKDAGRYFGCPANELIFLTRSEHVKLHNTGERNPMYGKPLSDAHRRKVSKALKGSDKHKMQLEKLHESNKGRPKSEETCRKLSEAKKAYWAKRRAAEGR